jgi:tetratricopeptide (TPR) repeat protein
MTKSIITLFLLIILINSCTKRDERTYDPQAVELNNKALELVNQDQLDSALLVYDQSIKTDKTYYFPHIGKSIIYMRKKDWNKAFEETQQAIKKNSDYAEGYQALGLIADAKGDSIEAKEYYNKAIKKFDERIKSSNDSNALRSNRFNKITTLILLNETQKAENEIEEFKRANPSDGLIESINTLSRDSILYMIKNP